MEAIKTYLIAIFLLLFFATQAYAQNSSDNPSDERSIKIKLKEKAHKRYHSLPHTFEIRRKNTRVNNDLGSFDRLNRKYNAASVTRIFPYGGKFEEKHIRYGLDRWYEIKFHDSLGSDIVKCLKKYERNRFIELSESRYIKKLINPVGYDYASASLTNITGFPNDSRFDSQWNLNNTGQNGGKIYADINVQNAWKYETGDTSVIVAVIDGGIATDHEDLKNALWKNWPEYYGISGIDDDNNGLLDDVYGYNFVDENSTIIPHYHGTHVAGIIGAVTNNSKGISGIAGGNGNSNGVRLMSCSVFSDNDAQGFEQAFVYAADNGAQIAQNSWGYVMPEYFERSILDAIDYFIENAGYDEKGNPKGPMQGGLVIFAAGNEDDQGKWYPAFYDPVIAVAATDNNDKRAYYSNYGDWVDISAPGSSINSTWPNNYYETISGTSMACPQVSGVAALTLSHYGKTGFTSDSLKNKLLTSVDDIDYLNPEFKGLLGKGRINAFMSVQSYDSISPDKISDLSAVDSSSNSVTLSWTSTGDNHGYDLASGYEIVYSTNPIVKENFDSAYHVQSTPRPKEYGTAEEFKVRNLKSDTKYYFAVKIVDNSANKSEISNVISSSTIPAPILSVNKNSHIVTLDSGKSETCQLVIKNIGTGELLFNIDGLSSDSVYDTLNILLNEELISDELMLEGTIFGLNPVNNTVFSMDPDNGRIIESFFVPFTITGQYEGLAYDGYYLYFVNENGMIYQIDPENQTVISSYDFEINHIDGLGCSGRYLYAINSFAGILYKIDFTSKTVVSYWKINDYVGGAVSFGGSRNSVFVSDLLHKKIFEISLISKKIVTIIEMESPAYGLAYSESNNVLFAGINNNKILAIDPDNKRILKTINSTSISGLASDEIFIHNWLGSSAKHGHVNQNDSIIISFAIDASNINPGDYAKNLRICSNDPNKGITQVHIGLHVEGIPAITADNFDLHFENSIINQTDSLLLSIINQGNDSLLIISTIVDTNVFKLKQNISNRNIASNKNLKLYVYFTPEYEGFYEGILSIYNNSPDSVFQINLSGNAILPPKIKIIPDSINVVVENGEIENYDIQIDNTDGNSSLFTDQYVENIKIKTSSVEGEITCYTKQILHSGLLDLNTINTSTVSIDSLPYKEGFESSELENWVNDGVNGVAMVSGDVAAKGERSFYLHQYVSNGHQKGIHKNFIKDARPSYMGYYTRSGSKKTSDSYFLISSGYNLLLYVTALEDGFIYLNPKIQGMANFIYDAKYAYNAYQWYHIEFKNINWDNKTFDFYIDNKLVSANISFMSYGQINGMDRLYLYNYSSNSTAWWDEIYLDDNPLLNWLSVIPPSCEILPGSSDTVQLRCDATELMGGTYKAKVVIKSNDPLKRINILPVNITVNGIPELTISKDTLEINGYVGLSISDTLSLTNTGKDELIITKISLSDTSVFFTDKNNIKINPGNSTKIEVGFKPGSPGSLTGSLTFHYNHPYDSLYTVLLTCTSIYPPHMDISVDTINLTINKGDSLVYPVRLNNTDTIQELITHFNKYYTKFNPKKSIYRDNPFYERLLKLPSFVEPDYDRNDFINDSSILILTHDFPAGLSIDYIFQYYYGLVADFVYVKDLSLVDLSKYKLILTQSGQIDSYYDLLSQRNPQIENFVQNGGILYYCPTDFNVALTLTGGVNSLYGFRESLHHILIPEHPILHDCNNNLDNAINSFNYFSNLYPGTNVITETSSGRKPTFIEYQYGEGLVIANGFWLSFDYSEKVSKTFNNSMYYAIWLKDSHWLLFDSFSDTVEPGTSHDLNLRINSNGTIHPGEYYANILLSTNDPLHKNLKIPVHLKVKGIPKIYASTDNLDMNTCYKGQTISDSIAIENKGDDILIINDIQTNSTSFYSDNKNFSMEPDEKKYIKIWFIAEEEKEFNAELKIMCNDPVDSIIEVSLSGTAIPPPSISASTDPIIVNLDVNDTTIINYTIANYFGDNTLSYKLFFKDSCHSLQSFETLITFDDIVAPTSTPYCKALRTEYSDKGIIFEGPEAFCGGAIISNELFKGWVGISEPNFMVIRGDAFFILGNQGSPTGPERMIFKNSVTNFGVNIGWGYGSNLIMMAINSKGIVVDSLNFYSNDTLKHFEMNGEDIKEVVISSYNQIMGLDDFYFRTWVTAAPSYGTIYATRQQKIQLKFISNNLSAGEYKGALIIKSNDPVNPIIEVPLILNVKGHPGVTLNKSTLNFGAVYVNQKVLNSVKIKNSGYDTLFIKNAYTNSQSFKVKGFPGYILPRHSSYVNLEFYPAETVSYSGKLYIKTNVEGTPYFTIPLLGQGLNFPVMNVSPSEMNVFLPVNSQLQRTFEFKDISTYCKLDLSIIYPDNLTTDTEVMYDSIMTYQGQEKYRPKVLLIGPDMQDYVTNTFDVDLDMVLYTNKPDTIVYSKYDFIVVHSPHYFEERELNPILEDYVRNGGIIFYCLDINRTALPPYIVSGITVTSSNLEYINEVTESAHPVFRYVPGRISNDYYTVNNCILSNLNNKVRILTRTFISKRPTTIEYEYGSGLVFASGVNLNTLFEQADSKLLSNIYYYIISQDENRWLKTGNSTYSFNPYTDQKVPVYFSTKNLNKGKHSANIVIKYHNTNDSIYYIPVNLYVVKPVNIFVSEYTFIMAPCPVGEKLTRSIQITNNSDKNVSLTNLQIDSEVFSAYLNNSTLLPGSSTWLTVIFSPFEEGLYESMITLNTSDPVDSVIYIYPVGITPDYTNIKKEIFDSRDIEIIHNPIIDELQITTTNIFDDLIVRIIDMNGRTVFLNRFNISDYNSRQTINIADIPQGFYVVNSISKDSFKTMKFIKTE
ncbi:MAG: choice-of-anchor D domain-containing protein [Clostridiales bacterium]|nr:choice-of-anchor D domain-containing protein [Clostridiales bacterium]